MITLVARQEASKKMIYLSPLIALAATLLSGYILFALLGFDPLDQLYNFFIKPLLGRSGVTNLVLKATPLVLIAIGLSLCYRANVWNIGAEGQYTLGAITGTWVALTYFGVDSPLLLPAMFIAGALGGLAWAAIPALFRTVFGASELLTSLMLVYVATQLLFFLVIGPWKDPDGFSFPQTVAFHDAARLPRLWEGTRMNWGAGFALLAVFGGWILIGRSLIGFQIKVAGVAPNAARFAGFSEKRVIWMTLLISGALAGIAGITEISGTTHRLGQVISPGYGFTAIIVAFLGRLNPIGILFAGLLMALSFLGGETVQMENQLPKSVGALFQGMLLFFLLAADVLLNYRIAWRRQRTLRSEPSTKAAG